MLEYYAREFSFTEVNSTFYHIPPVRVTEALVRKTPESFVFAVKAHGSLTHEREAELTGHAEKFRIVLRPLQGFTHTMSPAFPGSSAPTWGDRS